jgi:hypothetical protein
MHTYSSEIQVTIALSTKSSQSAVFTGHCLAMDPNNALWFPVPWVRPSIPCSLLTALPKCHLKTVLLCPGPPACRPTASELPTRLNSTKKSRYDRLSVCQSVLVSRPNWFSWTDINFCLTFLCRCRAPPLTRGRVCHLYWPTELLQFSNFAAGLCQLTQLTQLYWETGFFIKPPWQGPNRKRHLIAVVYEPLPSNGCCIWLCGSVYWAVTWQRLFLLSSTSQYQAPSQALKSEGKRKQFQGHNHRYNCGVLSTAWVEGTLSDLRVCRKNEHVWLG